MATRTLSKLAQSLSGSSLSAEERAAKAFQAQQDAIAKTRADLGKPVTTYDQAIAFGNSEIGKRIPDMDKWLYNLEWSYYNYGNAKPATRERRQHRHGRTMVDRHQGLRPHHQVFRLRR